MDRLQQMADNTLPEKPYIRFTQEEPTGASALIVRIAEVTSELNRHTEIDERRLGQLVLSGVRPIPASVSVTEVVCDGVPCEWVQSRRDSEDDRVIVYIHGGSWAFGSLESARPVSVRLAQNTGMKVLMVQYRLSPEHPYPAGLEDCYKVYRWLLSQGYPPEHIGFFGDSAGGNLSFALLHYLKQQEVGLPACVASASPATDLSLDSEIIKSGDDLIFTQYQGETHDIFSLYLDDPEADRKNPLISPLYGDMTGFPPLLIHAGGDEPIALDNIAFVEKAYSQGVNARIKVWTGMFHDFSIVGLTLKESRDSIREFGNFFIRHLQ